LFVSFCRPTPPGGAGDQTAHTGEAHVRRRSGRRDPPAVAHPRPLFTAVFCHVPHLCQQVPRSESSASRNRPTVGGSPEDAAASPARCALHILRGEGHTPLLLSVNGLMRPIFPVLQVPSSSAAKSSPPSRAKWMASACTSSTLRTSQRHPPPRRRRAWRPPTSVASVSDCLAPYS
jgi:hypothetical protein